MTFSEWYGTVCDDDIYDSSEALAQAAWKQALIEMEPELKSLREDRTRIEWLESIKPDAFFAKEEDCGSIGWEFQLFHGDDRRPEAMPSKQIESPTLREGIDELRGGLAWE